MQANLFSKYSYSEKVLTHSEYEYIYISPHLDDVPLSCSGAICQQRAKGFDILVVTVFAGEPQPPFSPFVQSVHRTWQTPEEAPCFPDLIRDHTSAPDRQQRFVERYWKLPQ